jgi:hypothetical protein
MNRAGEQGDAVLINLIAKVLTGHMDRLKAVPTTNCGMDVKGNQWAYLVTNRKQSSVGQHSPEQRAELEWGVFKKESSKCLTSFPTERFSKKKFN